MAQEALVTLWGVRGSIPSPGPTTARYGGNTSCVSVEWGQEKCLILDAGSGIRGLGKHLVSSKAELYLLLTHVHWDHIQGFPFFDPVYQPGRRIHLVPSVVGSEKLYFALEQMDGAHFPVRVADLLSQNRCIIEDSVTFFGSQGIDLKRIPVNHPGGAYGYRINNNGRSFVYIPDNELEPPGTVTTTHRQFVQFCHQADYLIHDAQYLPQDMPLKHGWGHSVLHQVLQLAAEAEVKNLVLFHHDPDRTDDQVDDIQNKARSWLAEHAPKVQCAAAHEGLSFSI